MSRTKIFKSLPVSRVLECPHCGTTIGTVGEGILSAVISKDGEIFCGQLCEALQRYEDQQEPPSESGEPASAISGDTKHE